MTPAQVSIRGVSKLDGIADVGTVIEVDGSSVNYSGATVALNSDDYQFNLKGDWNGKTFSATDNADVITNSASNIEIVLGDGNDKLTNFAASNVTITMGDGSDTIEMTSNVEAVNITDFSTDDRLGFAGGISSYSYSDGALTIMLTDDQVVELTGLIAPNNEAAWLNDVAVGETYSGKYFKLTSGIGSDVNIGNNFKGIATLGAGVKVSFNGGAIIEAVSGEISFNASNSTFNSLDNGDKFKIGTSEYTVGENCILKSGKVWLKPANVTLTILSTENNWTATVDGTIKLAATTETVNFYGADGKKIATFNGKTLTKENDSSTTITAGAGGVNVNVGENKFSVVSGAFKFDGTKLRSGTAKLFAENDAVKVGNNLITLTNGNGITVNAADSTIGGLNSGDKFKIGNDSCEVTANGIIKNNNSVHATANTLAINDTSWTAATIITGNAIALGNDTIYFDSTAKQVAKLENNTLTAIDVTDAANLTVNVGTGTYTLGKEFSNLKSGENSFKVTATGDYKVNGTTITLANVESIEIGGVTYSIDEKISKTISGNTYHLAKSETVTTSALTS